MIKNIDYRFRYIANFTMLATIVILIVSSSTSATVSTKDPDITGSYTGSVDLWYMTPQSYRKAGLNIENPNNETKLITGINMVFNLSESPGYRATVMVQRGELGEDQEAMTEHEITNFLYGEEKEQNFLFTEENYLIVDTNYNIQVKPMQADHLKLQCIDDDSESSFYWDPNTGDWDTSDETPNSPNIEGKVWAMNALVEDVAPLSEGIVSTKEFITPDAVDGYMADLQLGKTYGFGLSHSTDSNLQMGIYRDRNTLGYEGGITSETLLVSTSSLEDEKFLTLTANYTGRHYVIVKPLTGSGSYEIEFVENLEPVAIAGEDRYADFNYGELIEITLENELSYDPNDDTNDNKRIDPNEEDNLEYYWDFDPDVDKDNDGAPTNDMDATGKKVIPTFAKVGKYIITLTVVDPYGAFSSDTFDLYLNYIPIAKADVDVLENTIIYVGQSLNFTAEGSYDPDDDINGNGVIDGSEEDSLVYHWDLYQTIDKDNDGNYTNDADMVTKRCSIKYHTPGTYIITLNVFDDQVWNHTQVELVVLEKYDIGIVYVIIENTTVDFDAFDSYKDEAIINYTWTFHYNETEMTLYGDNPSFIFDIPGDYAIRLKAIDEIGNLAEDIFDVTVKPMPAAENNGKDVLPDGKDDSHTVGGVSEGTNTFTWVGIVIIVALVLIIVGLITFIFKMKTKKTQSHGIPPQQDIQRQVQTMSPEQQQERGMPQYSSQPQPPHPVQQMSQQPPMTMPTQQPQVAQIQQPPSTVGQYPPQQYYGQPPPPKT